MCERVCVRACVQVGTPATPTYSQSIIDTAHLPLTDAARPASRMETRADATAADCTAPCARTDADSSNGGLALLRAAPPGLAAVDELRTAAPKSSPTELAANYVYDVTHKIPATSRQ